MLAPQAAYPAVPFNAHCAVGNELEYVRDAIASGRISGRGRYTTLCEHLLREQLGAESVILTTSGTHALEMAALLLDLQAGDEFIVPSFAFVTTASAFCMTGAKPVFADVRPDTLNLDPAILPKLITPRTKAIVALHYAGIGCEMDEIGEIAARHGIPVVEDNALGLYGAYRSRPLGTIGTFGILSFHETKTLGCGEGGAIIVNDPAFVARAEIIRDKGTDRSNFFRGAVDRYTWVAQGSSYALSDLLAAYLYAQLESAAPVQSRRSALWNRYARELQSWADANGIGVPLVPAHSEPAYHGFFVLLPDREERIGFMRHLHDRGVSSAFHYSPLNRSRMAQRWGPPAVCPVAESASERIVRLPLFNSLSGEQQDAVISAVLEYRRLTPRDA